MRTPYDEKVDVWSLGIITYIMWVLPSRLCHQYLLSAAVSAQPLSSLGRRLDSAVIFSPPPAPVYRRLGSAVICSSPPSPRL